MQSNQHVKESLFRFIGKFRYRNTTFSNAIAINASEYFYA